MATERSFRPPPMLERPPADFGGSWPEYVFQRELLRMGYQPGRDFTFQSSQLGGRAQLGGVIIDFLFTRPPRLAVNIQGVYYHYLRKGGVNRARDIIARAQMAALGYQLVFVDDDKLLADPAFFVSEALAGRDHSRLGR